MTSIELQVLRREMGWTQAEMARATGKTVKSIANYEHGRARIPKSFELHVVTLKVLQQLQKMLQNSSTAS